MQLLRNAAHGIPICSINNSYSGNTRVGKTSEQPAFRRATSFPPETQGRLTSHNKPHKPSCFPTEAALNTLTDCLPTSCLSPLSVPRLPLPAGAQRHDKEGAFLPHNTALRCLPDCPATAKKKLKNQEKIISIVFGERFREEYLQFQCLHTFLHCQVYIWTKQESS